MNNVKLQIDKLRIFIVKILFWIAISIELFRASFCFAFNMSEVYDSFLKVMVMLLLLRIFLIKNSRKEWICIGIGVIFGYMCYRMSGSGVVLRAILLVLASKGIDRNKILKFVFYISLVSIVIIFALSLMGIHGDLYLLQDFGRTNGLIEKRYIFGYTHPNSVALVVNRTIMLGIYIFWSKINRIHILILLFLEIIVYIFCVSRTGLLVGLFILLLTLLFKRFSLLMRTKGILAFEESLLVFSVIFSALSIKSGLSNSIMRFIDKFITGRIELAYIAANSNVVSPFGLSKQTITDMGFVSLFYRQGVLFTILYIILTIVLLYLLWEKADYGGTIIVCSWIIINTVEAYCMPFVLHNYALLLLLGYWPTLLSSKINEKKGVEVFWWQFISIIGGKTHVS